MRNGKSIDRRLVGLVDPASFEAEQYRRLRHRIEEFRAERGVKVIAVTSAVASDGKTLTSVNLALTLARSKDSRVLLIDADLRRPMVAKTLHLTCPRGGFGAALAGHATLSDGVVSVPRSSLAVLPAVTSEDAYELLSSGQLSAVLNEARAAYDFVVVDTPPVIPVPDSALMKRQVDGYLVVVSSGRTPRKLVGEALNLLEASSVLGIVFNRDTRPLFGYYQNHYRQYFRDYVRAVGTPATH